MNGQIQPDLDVDLQNNFLEELKAVKIAAILTISGVDSAEDSSPESADLSGPPSSRSPYSTWEILGQSLVERTLERLKLAGVSNSSVICEDLSRSHLFPSRGASPSNFISAWESAISKHLNEGAELLLLLRMGSYVELDINHLLLTHTEMASTLTQVYDQKGALEIAAVNASALRGGTGSFRSRLSAAIPKHRRYVFSGYANRLKGPADFRRLTQDALLGRNAITPVGQQVSSGIWMAPDCRVDSTARITGPVYIGARSRIGAFCEITGATSIERDSEVDGGTHVQDSSILPETFLGMGLRVTNAIVSPGKLFHVERNIEVSIPDRRLVGKTFRLNSFADRTKSFFLGRHLSANKFSQPTAHVSASIHC
jgi:hypothetical protein